MKYRTDAEFDIKLIDTVDSDTLASDAARLTCRHGLGNQVFCPHNRAQNVVDKQDTAAIHSRHTTAHRGYSVLQVTTTCQYLPLTGIDGIVVSR